MACQAISMAESVSHCFAQMMNMLAGLIQHMPGTQATAVQLTRI